MSLVMRLVHVNVDQMQVFAMINDIGVVVNANVNGKN